MEIAKKFGLEFLPPPGARTALRLVRPLFPLFSPRTVFLRFQLARSNLNRLRCSVKHLRNFVIAEATTSQS